MFYFSGGIFSKCFQNKILAMIWLLSIGLIVQFCVLFSMVYLLKAPTSAKLQAVELCPRDGSVERVVILIGTRVEPKIDAARVKVDFGSNAFRWNAMRCIFQGIPERCFLGPSYVGIQSKVVYVGPRSVLEDMAFSQETLTSFYEGDEHSVCPTYLEQDRLNHILQAIAGFSQNEVFKEFTCGKTLFILDFSTSPLIANLTETELTGEKTNEKLEILEKHIRDIFPDNRTLYLMLPDFRYAEGSEDVQLWGTDVKNGYHLPMRLEDVCPLISVALGLEIPLYSHGIYHTSLLNMCPIVKSHWLVHNALQLHQLAYRCDRYRDIEKLKCATCKNDVENINAYADTVIRLSSEELGSIQHNLDVYLHTSVTICLFAWILVILTEICKRDIRETVQVFFSKRIFLGIIFTTLLGVLGLDYVILNILPYNFLDICFYNLLMVPFMILTVRIRLLLKWWKLKASISVIFITVAVIVAIVITSECLEGGYLVCLVTSLLPFLSVFPQFKNCPLVYQMAWCFLTFCICLLLLSPSYTASDRDSLQFINISGIIWMCLGGASMLFIRGRRNYYVSAVLIFCLLAAIVLAILSEALDSYFEWIRRSSWVLLAGITFPLFGTRRVQERFVHSSLSFAIPIVLQTVKLELLSYAFLLAFNLAWIYLETSHIYKLTEHYHQIRRGALLFFTLILGFLLVGKIEYHKFYDTTVMLLLKNAFDHFSYSLIIGLKYLMVFISMLMIYLSLIKFKQPSDSSFLYCYLFAEGMCLKKLIQFYYLRCNVNEELFKNVIANLFTLSIVFAYFLAHIYAAPPIEEEENKEATIQNKENTS